MKKLVFLILFSLVFSGCAFLKDIQKFLNPPVENFDDSIDDVIIKTTDGAFVISSLKLTPDEYGYGDTLRGVIKNNSKREYIKAKFGIKISDGRYAEYETNISPDGRVDLKHFFRNTTWSNEKKNVSIEFIGGDSKIDYDFLMTNPTVSKNLQYVDNSLGIKFDISPDYIVFEITNKTQNPIMINWTNFSYVDTQSRAHRLIHSNVKLIDAEKQQATTIIPPFALLKENVYPPDYIYNGENIPLLPNKSSERLPVIGKTFSFFMPIEINGVVKNYNFVFKITGEK